MTSSATRTVTGQATTPAPTAAPTAASTAAASARAAATERDELTAELRSLILETLVPLDDDELANDAPLVDEILDSLGIAEIAVRIEEHLGRPLAPEEETRATFGSIDAVVDFILTHR